MGFCGNCGKEADDNVKFCANCGKEIKDGRIQTQLSEQNNKLLTSIKEKLIALNISKRTIVLITLAVVVLFIVLSIWKTEKKKVDLNDCISVEFSGYETIGAASVNFDENKFSNAVLKAQGKNRSNTSNSDFSLDDLTSEFKSYQLEDSIQTEVTPSEGLKNGDKVTLKITYDNNVAKENGVKFIAKEQTFTVDGLKEVQELDLFKNLKVTFSGIAPNVSVSWTNDSDNDYLSYIYYSADKSNGINIGDTVTISADIDEDSALQKGYKITQNSKEYTCENADRYISSYNDIQSDTLATLQKESQDNLDASFAKSADSITNSGWTYEGAYLLTAKSVSDWNANSYTYLVYSTTVSSLDGSFEPTIVYFPVEYRELIQTADGKQSTDTNSPNIIGRSGLTFGWYSEVLGYTDGTSMFNDIVVSKKGNYTYDVSEGLHQFGN